MTRIFRKSRVTYGAPLTAMAVSAMLLMGSTTSANAGHLTGHGSGILGGPVSSGVIGGAIGYGVGGKKGILPGVVGGVIVNEVTRPRSRSRSYSSPPPPAPIHSGLVYNIQLSLTKLGYHPGPVDGVYGQLTADAIKSFEYNSRLPVTGYPSEGVYYEMQQRGG